MKPLLVLAIALLQGCATCQQHPAVCRAAIAVLASGAIYAASTHHTQRANQCANIGLQC
jgi:hypothetical protein